MKIFVYLLAVALSAVSTPNFCKAQTDTAEIAEVDRQKQLAMSVFAGKRDRVQELLKQGVSANFISQYGMTPVQIAKVRGHARIFDDLVQSGAEHEITVPDAQKALDAMLTAVLGDGQSPGVAVLITRDGKPIYEKALGMANLEKGIAIVPETVFRIGSITKPFTAAAILHLVEKGEIKLADSVSKYLSDFPRGEEITIHHLLTHTSGIYDFTHAEDLLDILLSDDTTEEDVLRRIKDGPSAFAPGKDFAYNNSGYFLLGYITKLVSKKHLGDYLKSEFFVPLSMNHTTFDPNQVASDEIALGYSHENGVTSQPSEHNWSLLGGAGMLFSTVGDLAKWNEAVFEKGLFRDAELTKAYTTPHSFENKDGYAYGWWIKELRGLEYAGHGGRILGYKSYLCRFPEQKLTIVILHNSYPIVRELDPEKVARVFAEVCLWRHMAPSDME